MKTYYSIRTLKASSQKSAIKKVEDGNFTDNEVLSDKVLTKKELTDSLFPNGFTSWIETHHEIVKAIESAMFYWGEQSRELPKVIAQAQDQRGTGGIYELAEDLTNEFESLHENTEWDGEFFDAMEIFLQEKLK